jgi:single-stranded-DNA-specific exonuclease
MQKRWKILTADKQKSDSLQSALKISPIICDILVKRGVVTFEESKKYFRPELKDLHDPWLMKDMDKAVERIIRAVNNNEKILVFGDYDVDGTTSVACMYRFLKKIHSNLDFYIPHRYREGYGVSKAGIDFANENGFTLIISLDCGIKSVQLIKYAKELEIDFVVCDHHLPDDELPPAVAILNPKQKDCNYPFKELCGCGVGFKLISALAPQFDLSDEDVNENLDLACYRNRCRYCSDDRRKSHSRLLWFKKSK